MKIVYEKQQRVLQHISKDGFYEIEIKDCETIDLHIQVDKRINASLLFTYDGEKSDIVSNVEIGEDADVSILFWNHVQSSLSLKQDISLKRNAQLHVGFGDINDCESTYALHGILNEMGSYLHLSSACQANKKHFVMEIVHERPYTKALMENFAIVDELGNYYMKATGLMKKGAHDSESHQTSRVLTLAENQKSEVVPILLIDENEVKASHATTLGQPDENQLYYLQSRGLSRKQALGLLTVGYLMPITEVIKDEDAQKFLKDEIEEKVIRNA